MTSSSTLDLTRHAPDEFEGKSVSIGGTEYKIAMLFRETDQGHAHRLRNCRSGLCLHVMQIRRNYLSDPMSASAASAKKAQFTTELRSRMFRDGGQVPVAPLRTIAVGNRVAELHELAVDHDAAFAELLEETRPALSKGDIGSVLPAIDRLLAAQPLHTAALAYRAHCSSAAGDARSALASMDSAIAIEPNLSDYRLSRMRYSLDRGLASLALRDLETFAMMFPGDHGADLFGAHIQLRRGDTDAAVRVFEAAALPEAVLKSLRGTLAAAREASVIVRALNAIVAKDQRLPEDTQSRLERAHALHPADSRVKANLGLALHKTDPARAARLLSAASGDLDSKWAPHCLIAAGHGLLGAGDRRAANVLFRSGVSALGQATTDIDPLDAPTVTTWIDFDLGCVLEANAASAASALEAWLSEPQPEVAPVAEVVILKGLYEAAAALQAQSASSKASTAGKASWWRDMLGSKS